MPVYISCATSQIVRKTHAQIQEDYSESFVSASGEPQRTTFNREMSSFFSLHSAVTHSTSDEQSSTTVTLTKACELLGNPGRVDLIAPSHDTGWAIDQAFADRGSVPLRSFCAWWLGEEQCLKMDEFFAREFEAKNVTISRQSESEASLGSEGDEYVSRLTPELVERHGLHLKYQVPTGLGSMAELFTLLQQAGSSVVPLLVEYSVSQPTLEEVGGGSDRVRHRGRDRESLCVCDR
jgi:hypothetical protein